MSSYEVYITAEALSEIKDLPGHMRQRVKRAIDALADAAYPAESKALDVPAEFAVVVCRLRLDKWRIVYLVAEKERTIDIIAVRKRPPYDYGDLETLLNNLD